MRRGSVLYLAVESVVFIGVALLLMAKKSVLVVYRTEFIHGRILSKLKKTCELR